MTLLKYLCACRGGEGEGSNGVCVCGRVVDCMPGEG